MFLVLCLCSNSSGQSIRHETGDIKLALGKAKKTGKAVCIMILPPENSHIPEGYYNIWEEPAVVKVLNKRYVNFVPSIGGPGYGAILKRYHVSRVPVMLFVDSLGQMFDKVYPDLKNPFALIADLDRASAEFSSKRRLSWYDKQYKSGNRDTSFLKRYIGKREHVGIFNNYEQLSTYAEQLPLKKLKTVPVTAYLLHTGLLFDSPIYNLITSNKEIQDAAWSSLTLKQRSEVKIRMEAITLAEAIKRKDAILALKWARYVHEAWASSNRQVAMAAHDKVLINYYKAVRNPSQLAFSLTSYIDLNFSKVTKDTVVKYQNAHRELLAMRTTTENERPQLYDKNVMDWQVKGAYAHLMSSASTELNNSAWELYLVSKDKFQLFKALNWSKQSIELDPKAEFYDTMAHLLYALGFYCESETTQLKAVDLSSSTPVQSEKYNKVLTKIRARQL